MGLTGLYVVGLAVFRALGGENSAVFKHHATLRWLMPTVHTRCQFGFYYCFAFS